MNFFGPFQAGTVSMTQPTLSRVDLRLSVDTRDFIPENFSPKSPGEKGRGTSRNYSYEEKSQSNSVT